jgi:hypothetical protein
MYDNGVEVRSIEENLRDDIDTNTEVSKGTSAVIIT